VQRNFVINFRCNLLPIFSCSPFRAVTSVFNLSYAHSGYGSQLQRDKAALIRHPSFQNNWQFECNEDASVKPAAVNSGTRAPRSERGDSMSCKTLKNFAPFLLIVLVALTARTVRSALPGLDPDEVNVLLQRSMERMDIYWEAVPGYDYLETDQQPQGGTKTYQELMILGSRYEHLIAIDGNPLSPEQEAQQQRKLDATIRRRQHESQEDRDQRLAKEEQVRKRDHALIEQIPKGFDFEYVDEEQLAGHECYVLQATPKAGYRPPNRETEVLKGARGRIWIDKETYNWVKAEAEVIHPVSIVAYLSRVEPGTRFELDMTPVSGDVWMPSHFTMRARAKVLFVFPHESSQDESYYGYHKAAQY
jgi:hypothetical protein